MSSFSSGRAYPSLNFLLLFFCLIPTLIMLGSTSFLTTPPRFLFLMCMLPYFLLPTDGRTDSFSLCTLSSSRNLFILGDFNCHHPLWDSRGTSNPREEKIFDWVISSDLLLNDPDTSTLLHRSCPDITFAPSSPTTNQFFYLSLSLRSFALTSVLHLSTFRKLAGTLTPTVLQKNTCLFPLLLLYLSGIECGQIFHSFRPHQTPS